MLISASAASIDIIDDAPAVMVETPETSSDANELLVLNDQELLAQAETVVESLVEEAATRGLFITLSNRKLMGQFYYGDSPFLVDSVKGPMATGPKVTFTTSSKIGANLDLGVSKSNIEASFGVDFEKSYELERVYQFDPIPSGKWLTYKAYTNYNKYQFDVYLLGTYQGQSRYWVPIGIVVENSVA